MTIGKIIVSLLLIICLCAFVFKDGATINDYKKFSYRTAPASKAPFKFIDGNKITTLVNPEEGDKDFEKFLKKDETVAFIVIRNDSIIYEKYFYDYTKASVIPSFSVAKSFISALIGFALQDGLIKSIDEPVANYLPELKNNGFEKVTIKNVLMMATGVEFSEKYSDAKSDVGRLYLGNNLSKEIAKLKVKNEVGKFVYISCNTQLLGAVLIKVLKGKTITDYLSEKLWQPLGMEYDATWSLDSKESGIEKTFCCLNARAIDFAKFGRFYLKKGNWQGKQLLNKTWIEESTTPSRDFVSFYKYHWWIPSSSGDFMAVGILGQYIYVNPNKNLIIVRMGKDEHEEWFFTMPKVAKQL